MPAKLPATLNFSDKVKRIFTLLSQCGEELNVDIYCIGGFVRDSILNRPSTDIDIVVLGSGIDVAKHFSNKVGSNFPVSIFKSFGTAHLIYEGVEIEFVGARKESYRADSRKPIVEDGSLEDDQNRRDFTINAMAISLNKRNYLNLLDPFDGFHDLEKKRIVTPLEPNKTFSDDPLRMLRAIRFASQLNFEIDQVSLASIKENKDRIKIISQERITTELNKIIQSKKPSIGFKHLFDTKLLHLIFPEMANLYGVEIRNGIGHKDNFYHTIEVLDNISLTTDDIWSRWAAILHDISKPATKRFSKEHGWTFHGHEVLGAKAVPKIFKRLKLPLDSKMKFVQTLVRLHLRPIALTKEDITDSAVRRLLFDAGDHIDELLKLCRADITSKNEAKVKRYLKNYDKLIIKIQEIEEKDKLRNWQPPVSGEEIMKYFGLKPSREVGIIKNAIREAILDGDVPNDYDKVKDYMIMLGDRLGMKKAST